MGQFSIKHEKKSLANSSNRFSPMEISKNRLFRRYFRQKQSSDLYLRSINRCIEKYLGAPRYMITIIFPSEGKFQPDSPCLLLLSLRIPSAKRSRRRSRRDLVLSQVMQFRYEPRFEQIPNPRERFCRARGQSPPL